MCTCFDTIKTSCKEVNKLTNSTVNRSFDMDNYLDTINSLSKDLIVIVNDTNNFIELVRAHLTELSKSEAVELLLSFATMRELMIKLYNKLYNSIYYKGMKTNVKTYRNCISDFNELCGDLKKWNIEIPDNKDFINIFKELSAVS